MTRNGSSPIELRGLPTRSGPVHRLARVSRWLLVSSSLLLVTPVALLLADDAPSPAPAPPPPPPAPRLAQRRAEITPAIRSAADRGVSWLREQQRRDGSWPCEPGETGDVASTAVSLLSLMGRGNSWTRGQDARAVGRGLSYVLSEVQRAGPAADLLPPNGSLPQRKLGKNIHTYLAALVLCEALGMEGIDERSRRVRRAATRLVRRISRTQLPDGSWNHDGWAPILATTSAFLALRSAHAVGIGFAGPSLDRVLRYVNSTYDRSGAFRSGRAAGIPLYDTCSALRILYGMGLEGTPQAVHATEGLFDPLRSRTFGVNGGEEYLAWWFATSSLVHTEGPQWRRWYPELARKLLAVQNADGSWSGHHCLTGRVFCTATALLALQTPYRYLPLDEL